MATPSVHSMPEHWTELSISKIQKKSCAEQVEAVKESCKKDCGKESVAECPECYGKLLDKLRSRYAESDEREWFAQRKAFLHELDGLFQDAKDRKRSINSIEARIESEKEAWYRWVLRRYPEFIASSDGAINKDELRGMLDDPDRSREELVKTMLEGIGKPADWPSSVETFAEKAAAAKSDAAELKKIYIAEFFMNKTTGEVLENAKKYLDEYQNSETLSLEDIIDKIVQDCQQGRSSMPQRDNHKKRLDELRRAKTAFEQNKMQAKGLRGAQAGIAGEELYSLPPCSVCRKTVSPQDVLSCSVCQAVAQLGGDSKLTLYCSEECYGKGHTDHVASQHDCESRDQCVQLKDEDVEMNDGSSTSVACTECIGQKQATLYCSERCAVQNIAQHRQSKHGVKTAPEEAQSLVTSLSSFVDSTLQSKNPGLSMSRLD